MTLTISTKNRYDVLILALVSIAQQTLKPKRLIIFDDGECRDLRQDGNYCNVFGMLSRVGVAWEVIFGAKKGQVTNHITAQEIAKTEWLYRLDDDNVLMPDTLEKLYAHTSDPKVAGVASVVLHPDKIFPETVTSASMSDVLTKYAVQFASFEGVKEVEHFYSTFLYRREIGKGCYCRELSPVGHREESIMSYEMFRKGHKLLVDGSATTWHLRAQSGGIRDFRDGSLWGQDERVFQKKLNQWNVRANDYIIMCNVNGIGDHYAMACILDRLKEKYPARRIIIGATYPDVFADRTDVEVTSVDGAKILRGNDCEDQNIYKFMIDKNWKGSIVDAYWSMYE